MDTAKPYHHGDLRRTLLQTYLDLLQSGEGWQFTLRDLAKRAGVSHTAAYKHFPDKASLLAEVAMHGFDQLGLHIQQACKKANVEERPGFITMCQAYVRFGATHRNLYRVMFSAEARECANPNLREKGLSSLGVLVDAVERGHRAGWLRKGDAFQQAHTVWALLHGLTVLSLDGLITPSGGTDATTKSSIELILEGLQAA